MLNKLFDSIFQCGITGNTRFNVSATNSFISHPSEQEVTFTLSGYMVILENYYVPYPPEATHGLLFPYAASDIGDWEWTWTSSAPLIDYGNQVHFHKEGNGGKIQFHNDINDPNREDRAGDVLLPAWTLALTDSGIFFHTNDYEHSYPWHYDKGVTGIFPNYELTDTLIFHSDESEFFGPRMNVVTFTKAPRRCCPLRPLWRWLYRL